MSSRPSVRPSQSVHAGASAGEKAFPWHAHNERWTVVLGSPQHTEMQRVLDAMK